MAAPLLQVIAAVLPSGTETEKVDLARTIVSRLRDHDLDPDVLASRLEVCDAARATAEARVNALVSANDAVVMQGARNADALAGAQDRAASHAKSTAILALIVTNQPWDSEVAKAVVAEAQATDG